MPRLNAIVPWLDAQWSALGVWVHAYILTWSSLAQLLAIALSYAVAYVLARPATRFLLALRVRWQGPAVLRLASAAAMVALPAIWLALAGAVALVARTQEVAHLILNLAITLLYVWVIIRLATRLLYDARWTRFVAVSVWVVATLDILGLLGPAVVLLDRVAIAVGNLRISALAVIQGLLALIVLVWSALAASRAIQGRLERASSLVPSLQVLFVKLLKVGLVALAIVVALSVVGIDLTAFAFLGGAIGLGLGFGLQKVVSNFVSGIILLLDRSIKPGDVIAVGNTFGWVTSLGARYTSLTTRDGIEHLVPNEVLIAERVENWTFSDHRVRFKIPFGISYESDVCKAIEVAVEAAARTPRVLAEPKPVCHLMDFGDNAINLELRLWIRDPENGVTNVLSAARLAMWDSFREVGIAFPFPQQDVHVRTPLRVKIERSD